MLHGILDDILQWLVTGSSARLLPDDECQDHEEYTCEKGHEGQYRC